MTSQEQQTIVAAFAKALDEGDYKVAETCLHPNCIYNVRGDSYLYAEPILESYRIAHAWVLQTFDTHSYEHKITPLSEENNFCIEFKDCVTLAGVQQSHTCRQHIQLDTAGKIILISHIDIPEEVTRMTDFIANASQKKTSPN